MTEIPSETPAIKGTESVEPRVIFYPDQRIKVNNTQIFPYSAIVYIRSTFPNGGVIQGSGSMIGKDSVLTAGHCIFDKSKGGWATSVEVSPGKDGSNQPYGTAQSIRLSTTEGWKNSTGTYSNEHDIGLIRLNQNIGTVTGNFGMNASVALGTRITLSGYHGDKNGVMYTQSGYPKTINGASISHQLDTTPGASGSAVYNDSQQIVAVHAGGNSESNLAPRFDWAKYQLVYTWATGKNPSSGKVTGVNYNSHVLNNGWMGYVANGQTSGTTNENKRMEALRIVLQGYSGGVQYRAHTQNIGWMSWVSNDQTAGTTGEKRQMEAVQIKLTGAIANTHNIEYRAHVKNKGWTPWVRNGETAGTIGQNLQMESIQIRLVGK
nr:trypsin-like serine protease [Enterococcus sp. 665A]